MRSASGEQPIFWAIERTAAHWESRCYRWSKTIRTARSRTSGEYLLDLPMAPSSEETKPPGKPERFRLLVSILLTSSWLHRLQI